jgi:hypothetical protein
MQGPLGSGSGRSRKQATASLMGRDPRSERHGTKGEGTLSREASVSQVAPEKRVKRRSQYAPVGDGWDGTGALGLEESSRYKLGPRTRAMT